MNESYPEEDFVRDLVALRGMQGYSNEIRAFAARCARPVQHLMTDKRSVMALEVGERFAHGLASVADLARAYVAACEAADDAEEQNKKAWRSLVVDHAAQAAQDAAEAAVCVVQFSAEDGALVAADNSAAAISSALGSHNDEAFEAYRNAREAQKRDFMQMNIQVKQGACRPLGVPSEQNEMYKEFMRVCNELDAARQVIDGVES